MQQQDEGGSIVNIGSVSGQRPTPQTAAYGAAKAGLVNFTQTTAVEWAPKVRVNHVTAGMVRTEQSHLFYGDEAGIAKVGPTVPLGRIANPSDIGDACVFLASPLAAYVSGANLAVHGGGEPPPYLDVSALTRRGRVSRASRSAHSASCGASSGQRSKPCHRPAARSIHSVSGQGGSTSCAFGRRSATCSEVTRGWLGSDAPLRNTSAGMSRARAPRRGGRGRAPRRNCSRPPSIAPWWR